MSPVFKYVHLALAGLIALASLSLLSPITIPGVINTLVFLTLGLGTGYLEFKKPPQVGHYASFLLSFAGRGAFYAFVGFNLIYGSMIRVILGAVLVITGAVYVGLEFSTVSPPDSLRFDPEVPIDTI